MSVAQNKMNRRKGNGRGMEGVWKGYGRGMEGERKGNGDFSLVFAVVVQLQTFSMAT